MSQQTCPAHVKRTANLSKQTLNGHIPTVGNWLGADFIVPLAHGELANHFEPLRPLSSSKYKAQLCQLI